MPRGQELLDYHHHCLLHKHENPNRDLLQQGCPSVTPTLGRKRQGSAGQSDLTDWKLWGHWEMWPQKIRRRLIKHVVWPKYVVSTCMGMHTHAHTHTHSTSTYAYTPTSHMHTHRCTHVNLHPHIYACIHACTSIFPTHIHTYTHTYRHTCENTHEHIHAQIPSSTHAHIPTSKHVRTCMSMCTHLHQTHAKKFIF